MDHVRDATKTLNFYKAHFYIKELMDIEMSRETVKNTFLLKAYLNFLALTSPASHCRIPYFSRAMAFMEIILHTNATVAGLSETILEFIFNFQGRKAYSEQLLQKSIKIIREPAYMEIEDDIAKSMIALNTNPADNRMKK